VKYLLDQHELVANFVAAMIPHVAARGFGACRAIGILDDKDELVAGLVYSHFNPEAGYLEISGAALPRHQWATRQTLVVMHAYPFLQLQCQMVVMRVAASDERLLRQLRALGYEFIGVPRLFGRDRDGMLCYLTDDAWKANKITRRLLRASKQQQEAA
jgi:RimJ/RimL family protein N-acetyltransferase